MSNLSTPVIRRPAQGRTVAVVGDIYRFLATGEDTNGKYAMWEAIVPPGGGPPPHVHTREDEFWYVLDGTFDLDGELPVNPDGGLKSFGHPIGASGLRMLFECWLQLRGLAGERQINNGKKLGLTHNLGGRPGTCVSFVSVVGSELD